MFNNTFRHFGRTREIIKILIKYGFEEIVFNSFLQNLVPRRMLLNWTRDDRNVSEINRWERIRMVCEELGPSAIKIAQIASNRSDVLPDELIKELQKLQSEVKTFPFSIAKRILERELPKPIDEIFESFNEVPIGSASIGQVYLATLRSGERVVVKLRRPNVDKMLHEDLEIIESLLPYMEKIIEQNGSTLENVKDAFYELKKNTLKELDYINEARNIEQFRKFYEDRHDFYVPKAYRKYSTEQLLIIEFAAGCKINDIRQLRQWGISPYDIAERGLDIYLTQIFEFGYFHADPHPGNIIIQEDGRICLIDFGMVGKLVKRDKIAFANVFIAMNNEDAQAMALNMKKLCISHDIENIRLLENDFQEIIDEYGHLDIAESKMEDLIVSLQLVMRKYNMRVPGSVTLIFRALAVLEGIGKDIHPNINMSELVKPFGFRVLKEQYSMQNILDEASFRFNQLAALLNNIPIDVRTILKKTRQGKLSIQINHKGYDPFMRKLDRVVNRFILAFIIFTLTVSSSILALVPFPERYMTSLGIPYLSAIGYFFSIFLGAVLLFAVLRTRKVY